jgi:hypothetical protein
VCWLMVVLRSGRGLTLKGEFKKRMKDKAMIVYEWDELSEDNVDELDKVYNCL